MQNKKTIIGIIVVGIAVMLFLNMCSTEISYSNTDSGFTIKADCSYSTDKCTVSGCVTNDNSRSYHTVQIRVLLYDESGRIIGSEGFFINDINGGESRDFQEIVNVDEKPDRMVVEIFGLL